MNPLPLLALLALATSPQGAPPAGAADPRAVPVAVETPLRLAARLASRQFPKARWRLGEARSADFTYDGQADLAFLGVDATALVVVVVVGPITERSRVLALSFPSGVEAADAICGTPAAVQANTERPDARGLSGLDAQTRELVEEGADANGLGLVLIHARGTGYCEALHLLYDGSRLAWWREPPGPT
jgi:hypothetical protein